MHPRKNYRRFSAVNKVFFKIETPQPRMAKENFEMDTTLRKRKKGVRFGPFALFLLAAALTSAIVVIIILSIFFVRQGEEIFKLQEERDSKCSLWINLHFSFFDQDGMGGRHLNKPVNLP